MTSERTQRSVKVYLAVVNAFDVRQGPTSKMGARSSSESFIFQTLFIGSKHMTISTWRHSCTKVQAQISSRVVESENRKLLLVACRNPYSELMKGAAGTDRIGNKAKTRRLRSTQVSLNFPRIRNGDDLGSGTLRHLTLCVFFTSHPPYIGIGCILFR